MKLSPMAADLAIDAQHLTKIFRTRLQRREFRAVDDVSIQVARGTTYGLLGPNGAGKTTFVKMLLSAVHPTRGVARVFGRDSREPAARAPIGYLPENHRFPTYFTGHGMLDFYAALSGLDRSTRSRRIPELLEMVGLADWGRVRLRKYSKGMLQRLGLAQALIHRPDLLILDEPSDGVDPVGRKQIREILERLEQQGVTIFINSHLLVEVEMFCREVAILHKGRVALTGHVKELTTGRGYRLTVLTGQGLVEQHYATRDEANAAVDRCRAEGHQVESLIPTTSTLEEIFMDTVGAA